MRRRTVIVLAAGGIVLATLLLVAGPIAYVETACRATPQPDRYAPLITESEWQRPEPRTFLTYPEWHMVYAYEDFAERLQQGDEHGFDYRRALRSFWSSYCELNRQADAHGGGDLATRQMIYVIGTSFNAEFAAKALYEETIGRLAAALRGPVKTPQDGLAAEMAREYGAFLHQVPWYRFPFSDWTERLWALPADSLRGWERRLALGAEWRVKQAYANLIAQAVAAAGPDELRVRSVTTDLPASSLSAIPGVAVLASQGSNSQIETDRYAAFTVILAEIARSGAEVIEIAGNDDIMVSIMQRASEWGGAGRVVQRFDPGPDGRIRMLVLVKVTDLAELFRQAGSGYEVEHVFDY